MQSKQPRSRPGDGGGRRKSRPAQPPEPNHLHNPNFIHQNPTTQTPFNQFSNINRNFRIQNPNFTPNQSFLPQPQHSALEIDQAVEKAHRNLLTSQESVTAWKVSQSALLTLQVDSWDSLGFQMQQIPSLHRIILTEGKINAFINCFVAVRRVTSLSDLELAICQNEGVEHFEELELGPLVRHPLVRHYFSVSSDVTEVYKITSEEIVSFIRKFMDTKKFKPVQAEELLNFIAEKRSVSDREKLQVRIQSLGMHISHLRKVRALESQSLKECFDGLKRKREEIKLHLCLDDNKLECNSQSGTDLSLADYPMRMFVTTWKHVCKENDVTEVLDRMLQPYNVKQIKKFEAFCSHLPVIGILVHIAVTSMKSGMWDSMYDTFQAFSQHEVGNISSEKCTEYGRIEVEPSEKDLMSTTKHIFPPRNNITVEEVFITTWKEACKENDIAEVVDRMLQPYALKKIKKFKVFCSNLPVIGMLVQIAVTSMKIGMWDSMHDTFQAFSQHGVGNISLEKCTEYESIEVEPSEMDLMSTTKHISPPKNNIAVEDIVEKISTYFELDQDTPNKSSTEKTSFFLRKLCECKFWLAEQFSVKEFESLGYGEFLMFLERYASRLQSGLKRFLTVDTCDESQLVVCIRQHQLAILLSQASNNLWENEDITNHKISVLLTRQYPSVSFRLVESSSTIHFLDSLKANEISVISKCIIFSATLLGTCGIGDPLACNDKNLSETAQVGPEISYKAGALGSVTTKDAIQVLLRAPMLSDIGSWSHWDLIYGPSLGPLVDWLLNEFNRKELLCLVTKDGKVVRIDHSATLDSFLEAFLQGSSFQTAVQLLSLFSLYGGVRHVPLSLLKCHARHAFEVLVKNSTEMEVDSGEKFSIEGSPLCREQILDEDPSCNFGSELHKCKNRVNKAMPVASRFILDLLGYLPSEFRSFAADVLLSGLRFVIKDAHSAILSECKKTEQCLMLHEVGLSLGIVEWIDDYHVFSSSTATNILSSEISCFKTISSDLKSASGSAESEMIVSVSADLHSKKHSGVLYTSKTLDVSGDSFGDDQIQKVSELDKDKEAALVIESIRREEFGLDPSLSDMDSSMLKKQHARLGRALHCLSQELYSQDSHFLLELVQNADDNVYPESVEPTLTFILQEAGIVVLNNELGFSAQNIRALCDVGNSTKKGCGSGYIGKKGIGFKSVFRVTDAPEIHSNGFHVKFDTSEGQIGFVLPTLVPPCDMDLFGRLASIDTDPITTNSWKTCIVLPFKSKLTEGSAISSIISMFSDLHPSLLLFLHRLQCIKFRNMLDDTFVIMRKETVGNGITRVSLGNEIMTWFVASQELQSGVIRPDVQRTEISIAFTLQESDDGGYIPHLGQQPVFAFLPLRTYGLKCILQGDFALPSSREEVDGDSPWNQWLLSKFPDLFVSAERSFCGLSCFRVTPGKAVAAFMSFVPLMGEVHGFFSNLPRIIISKLRLSNCLLLEGNNNQWVPPCKVLRNWNEQARTLLPDSLLREHLGLGFLDKSIVLSDSLAGALGIEEYGPKVLLQIMSSICLTQNGLKSLGLVWLSSWLNTLYTMLFHSSAQTSLHAGMDSDLVNNLQKIPLVPLSDGTYGSVDEGTIWLHLPSDALSAGFNNDNGPEAFPKLFAKLRTVSAALFSTAVDMPHSIGSEVENVTRMLERIGIQRLSAHEIVKVHILPAISDGRNIREDKNVLIEYLSFVMFHLQSSCPDCSTERVYIISELYNKALILTNHGYKRPVEVPMHFNKIFGSSVDVSKLIVGTDLVWHEVDISYLQHPINKSLSGGRVKWRKFFQELGVTDFVHIVPVEKNINDVPHVDLMAMMRDRDLLSFGSTVKDWESQELVYLLSKLSSSGDRKRSQYLLEVLDTLWDDYICDKVTGYFSFSTTGDSKPFKSSFISSLFGVPWIASRVDNELHYPKDLFYDCDAVRSILGATAPYAVPKVRSGKLSSDIGFKTQVNLDDILKVLQVWRSSETPFQASITQMAKLYNFIWNEMTTSKQKIEVALNSGPFIFVPYTCSSSHDDVVPGFFLNPVEVHWHDSTVSMHQMKEIHPHSSSGSSDRPLGTMLCNIYPGLHDFFVNHCGVNENPPFSSDLHNLQQLSTVALPSQTAKTIFRVFSKWADGLKSGSLSSEDIVYLRECLAKLEYTVLPTIQDKWVSLHASFGLVCWCDDEMLGKEFNNIDFLYFGELSDDEKEIMQGKNSILMQTLGIPALSEVVTREAIYYGPADSSFKSSLVNWALPYAQRYIYNLHPNQYSQLKQSGFEKLCQLQITVVEKLFYKNVIKKSGIASKKRFECSCLLQDDVLYSTRDSNSHSVFMELSRLLFGGTTELHLANFLHMITTMAESGSTEEQNEFFILNSQKLPKLPDGESVWSLSSISSSTGNDETFQANCDPTSNKQRPPKSKRKPGISTNWPPEDWKTAPGFGFAGANATMAQAPQANSTLWLRTEDVSEDPVPQTDHIAQPNIDSETTTAQPNVGACATDPVFDSAAPHVPSSDGPTFNQRDQLSLGNPNPQEAALTGRTGELVAFNYFSANAGKTIVKWVNQENETGLPYDLVIGDDENNLEYIEVKATKSARKDWFSISVGEWQFAVEKGESFSVAHVLLGRNPNRITVFRNPVRLSQLGKLQLAVQMPNPEEKNSSLLDGELSCATVTPL